ncbi:MAG: NAD(P)/FAD-dependent oxidoreductase [Polaribacter sp.]|uniref:lycopene cyclase family protein n=1 Tax=Polaribacter sp. TaxID=1920175 RepID=UPI003BAE46D5
MEKFDVVIIGAGSAGIMLARELGKLKHKTLVLDRKTNLLEFSFNTLGSFINLDDFGLTKNVVAQEIDTCVFYSKHIKRKVKAEKENYENISAYILDKKKLHEEIINSIDTEFVDFQLDTHIKSFSKDDEGNYTALIDKNNNSYSGKIFVDASGTNAVISKQIGLRPKNVQLATGVEYNVKYFGKPNEIHLMVGKIYQGGYGWVFPLQNQRAIIGFGSFDNHVIKELKNRLNLILEIPKIKKLVEKDNEKVEGGSIPLTPVLDKFIDKNLICVGDSVSQVNPIVGEGYKFIFEAAVFAVKAIDKALNSDDLEQLSIYEKAWKARFFENYKRSKKSQDKLFRYSKKDYLMDFGLLLMRLRSNERMITSLSGEYGLENKV